MKDAVTYDIQENQLVRLFHGRPETAWDINEVTKGTIMRNVVMKIDGIIVAVLVEHDCLQGKDFDELCTALLLTIANQTGKAVSKEVQEGA